MDGPIPVRLMLAAHATTQALTEGKLDTGMLSIEHLTSKPIYKTFAPMVRQQAYDASELAIVTALQAIAEDSGIVPLPITVAARFQHKNIIFNRNRGVIRPSDLPGKRVGVRSYTQTTGAWVRAILEREYGVASSSITWVTTEKPHVAKYRDPDNVVFVGTEKGLLQMLADGDIDAVIFGNDLPDEDWVGPVIEHPNEVARARFASDGIVQINHVVCVAKPFARQHPEAVRTLMSLFTQAKEAAPRPKDGIDLYPIGLDAMRPSVDVLLHSAHAQKLIARPMTPEIFFADAVSMLAG
ncbi:PhnD/SsuA/transferrin family substrate-binding protein [Rhizobium halophytocola]|uniref:4,5-dihydroxyphthalate decarboxylase n=1 Tax=Rhizobium halophytocola TaxID=735519 RepID=A0ABS4DUR5_9HYPH|nr:PhnD/SsuA/transferrin family substrate-binding protein [Rhizobium halophytocola]MBP1849412.1 4,5-dihydroxyphthalate decarboxylase [Rhizobium halophytocola]